MKSHWVEICWREKRQRLLGDVGDEVDVDGWSEEIAVVLASNFARGDYSEHSEDFRAGANPIRATILPGGQRYEQGLGPSGSGKVFPDGEWRFSTILAGLSFGPEERGLVETE